MKKRSILGGAAAVAVLAAGGLVATTVLLPSQNLADCRGGQAPGDLGGPFTLVNSEGETVTDQQVITEPSLVYFGFSYCPDVCPIDNARNAQAVEMLEDRGISATPIFISVDPERDTPEVMESYTSNFSDKMIGLTGSPEQVKAAADEFRVYFKLHKDENPENYSVDHSAMTYLVLPEEGFMDFFRRDASAEAVADKVQCFVEASA